MLNFKHLICIGIEVCIYRSDLFLFGLKVPEMRDKILQENEGKWKKIAKKQMKSFFDPSRSDLKMQAKR